MRVVAIVQAHLGSTRLPSKVLHHIGEKPMIIHVLDRAKGIPGVDVVVVAVPDQDETLAATVIAHGHSVHGGPETDVLTRYYWTARNYQADHIVRITADCPLLDPKVAGHVLDLHLRTQREYTSNIWPKRTYPDGLDVEVFTRDALYHTWKHAPCGQREHPTLFMRRRSPQSCVLCASGDLSSHRWTVDTEEDLEFVREVFHLLPPLAYQMEDTLGAINNYHALCEYCRHGEPHLKCGHEIIWDLHQLPNPGGRVFVPCEAWAIKKRCFVDQVEAY